MKNFKLKSILFSLLAVLMTSVFITSCGQEEIPTDLIVDTETTVDQEAVEGNEDASDFMKTPKGFENLPEAEQQDYLGRLTATQTEQLKENFRIADYLTSVGLLQDAEKLQKDGELLLDINLANVLSPNQLRAVVNHVAEFNYSRGCYYISGGCTGTRCSWNKGYQKRYYYCNGSFHGVYFACVSSCSVGSEGGGQ